MQEQTQVAIIGAGPLGIELAAALKQADITHLLFDKGQCGQMVYNFPPETVFFSSTDRIKIAGIDLQIPNQQKCSRENYLAYLRMVVNTYQLKINSYEEITRVQNLGEGNGFILFSNRSGIEYQYKTQFLVLATGGTSHPRLLNIPGETLSHVSIKMKDPHHYFQKKVLVIGSRNSAAETALRCCHAGAFVTLVFRREELDNQHIKYWLLPELKARIEKKEIIGYSDSEVIEIYEDRVLIRKKGEGDLIVPCDFVIKALGFDADMTLLTKLGVPLIPPQGSPSFNEDTMETPIPGVFVLGTIVGGTQIRYRVFIENCHIHVKRIMDVLGVRLGKTWQPAQMFLSNDQRPLEE